MKIAADDVGLMQVLAIEHQRRMRPGLASQLPVIGTEELEIGPVDRLDRPFSCYDALQRCYV